MKNARACLLAALCLLALLSAAGCGNKGELVRPTPKSDAPAGS
jgi:predicted small lipoprotein YifL